MTAHSPAARLALAPVQQIALVLWPALAARSPAAPVAGSARLVAIAAHRSRALAEAALDAVRTASLGGLFPLNALGEMREYGLRVADEVAR